MSKPFDYESLARLRRPPVRHLRLLMVVVGLLCVMMLLSTRTARDYVPLGRAQVPRPNAPVNVTIHPAVDPITQRANATILMLARNDDLGGVEESMRALEAAFNHKHNYPWTFLNEVPFSLEFKRHVRSLTNGDVHFGLIRSEHWYPPDWIDEEKYEHDREAMKALRMIPYAGSMPYRNMCRFNSGFFFRQDILKQFKWYWRVEPKVRFPCDIPFDPFVYMIENNKRYSFTITIPEFAATIPTLWDHTKSFMSDYSELLADNNALSYLTDDNGESYNKCHFWSNFEIADLDFFRSDAYMSFFSRLDSSGNFFYERWGDAPVHSIGVALLLPREQIHYFRDIGYYHSPMWNCPEDALNQELQCSCQPGQAFDAYGSVCLEKFESLFTDGITR
ncbi:hypothetical protein M0805_004776 [Coniferiporia weirii]|nr:hypothetical protein M0805_004776 [Coniferiporia weirii]